MDLAAENAALRDEIEAYRLSELTGLRQQLAEAKTASDHYRNEAQRNAELGKQIATEAQQRITELQAKLQRFEQANVRTR